jgi:hypothetical protein
LENPTWWSYRWLKAISLGVKEKEIWLKYGKSLPLKMNVFFGSWAILTIPNFLEVFILLPFFNDGKLSWVNKRHLYEVDEKKTTQKGFG